MLKKLVKYGNSNALILDKAILELLGIEEGATIKIKTDGTSIIITPHTITPSQTINEIYTHDQATFDATIKEVLKKQKRDKNLDAAAQKAKDKKFALLMKEYKTIQSHLAHNPEFIKEIKLLAQRVDSSSPEFLESYKIVRNRFYPELADKEKELLTVQTTDNLSPQILNSEQQKAMELEFFNVHKKNHAIYAAYNELLNNPEYQHKAQLLAEKYQGDKNSADYLKETNTLIGTYLPEFLEAQAELQAIAQRYT